MANQITNFLSIEDVKSVIRHPDESVRAIAAQKVCREIRAKSILSDEEREFAHSLLAYMAKDSADIVRRALAITLKNSPNLSRDVALKLAGDLENIAVPVITHSPVFSDDDLISILKSKAAAKSLAVAKRLSVSDHVVRAIIRFGDSHAVAEVAANDGALISEQAAEDMLRIYKNNDLVAEAMIARRDLPIPLMERLISMGSEEVAVQLNEKHDLPLSTAIDIANRTRERAIIDFFDEDWCSRDTTLFVKRLHSEKRLTHSLLMRAMCMGQMRFAEQALACFSGINLQKVVLMLHDGGPFGLKALCRQAGIPKNMALVLESATLIYRDFEASGLVYQKDNFRERMIQRVLTLPYEFPENEQLWFLEKLDSLTDEAA